MPFSPCANDGSACTDASVNILSRVFGPVIDSLTRGEAAENVSASTNIIASMIGVFNSGIFVIAGFMLSGIVIMSVINTANDGEVMKNSSLVTSLLRLLSGVTALLPTASGYSFIQLFVLAISLWGIGLANYAYKTGVQTDILSGNLSVISATKGISDKSLNESYALADIRTFAEGLTRAFYCAHVANANFVTASGERVKIGTRPEPEAVIEESSRTAHSYWISDRNVKTNLAGGEPVCGTITSYTYKPKSLEMDAAASELQALRFALYEAKSEAITSMYSSIQDWVSTWPTSAEQGGDIQSNRLNEIVADTENRFRANFVSRVKEDASLNKILDDYTDNVTQKGWLYAGGFYQKLAQARSTITDFMTEPVAVISPPDASGFPNSEQSRIVQNSLDFIPSLVFSRAMDRRTTVELADIKTVLESELSAKASVNGLKDKTDSVFNAWLDKGMQAMLGTLLGTDGSVDAITRIKLTGDVFKVLAASGSTAGQIAYSSVSTARTLAAGAGSVRIFGNSLNLEPFFKAILDLVNHNIVQPLAQITTWFDLFAFYFGVFLPTLPYTIFIVASVGYFLQVIQTVIAVSLWAMMHLLPDRTFIGSQTQGYLMLLGLLVRPALMVLGLFASFLLINPILSMYTEAFFEMKGAVAAGTHWTINAMQWKNWIILYGLSLLPIMFMIFGLSQILPSAVLHFIGAGIEQMGETQATSEMRSNVERHGPSRYSPQSAADSTNKRIGAGEKSTRHGPAAATSPITKSTSGKTLLGGGSQGITPN